LLFNSGLDGELSVIVEVDNDLLREMLAIFANNDETLLRIIEVGEVSTCYLWDAFIFSREKGIP